MMNEINISRLKRPLHTGEIRHEPISYMERHIVGQNDALDSLNKAMSIANAQERFGLPTNKPKRVLVFAGPTGVGKTKTARHLAEGLHPDTQDPPFLKIDCSLFSEGHGVASLVGAPPAYVGREQPPLLDPAIIKKKNSVVLFDEIEKGTPELWNLMLQIMEDGEITLLNGGRKIDFRNAYVIMTSNAGAREMKAVQKGNRIGFYNHLQTNESRKREDIEKAANDGLRKIFAPEWLDRVDDVIVFNELQNKARRAIFDTTIRDAQTQYISAGLEVTVTDQAKRHLLAGANNGRDARRAVHRIDATLADLLGSGGLPEGSYVVVDWDENEGLVCNYREDNGVKQKWIAKRTTDLVKAVQAVAFTYRDEDDQTAGTIYTDQDIIE